MQEGCSSADIAPSWHKQLSWCYAPVLLILLVVINELCCGTKSDQVGTNTSKSKLLSKSTFVTLYPNSIVHATILQKILNMVLNREGGRRLQASKGQPQFPNLVTTVQIKRFQLHPICDYIPNHAVEQMQDRLGLP